MGVESVRVGEFMIVFLICGAIALLCGLKEEEEEEDTCMTLIS